jgi:hypothetical protein
MQVVSLTREKSPRYPGGSVGRRAGPDTVAKRKTSAPAENRTPVVQPVA